MSLYPNYFIDNGVGVTNVSGDKKVGIGIDGVSFQKDILTTPITTILDGDGFDFAGEIVSWDNIYNLKQATTTLRLPATPNVLVLDDTLECNDNNLSKTRTAVLNASPLVEPSLTLTNITSGESLVAKTNEISITDGVITNTINKTGYTTRNSVQNLTHYLNFSDSSSTGTGAIQKTAGITCNPSTNTISATAFTISGTPSNSTDASTFGQVGLVKLQTLTASITGSASPTNFNLPNIFNSTYKNYRIVLSPTTQVAFTSYPGYYLQAFLGTGTLPTTASLYGYEITSNSSSVVSPVYTANSTISSSPLIFSVSSLTNKQVVFEISNVGYFNTATQNVYLTCKSFYGNPGVSGTSDRNIASFSVSGSTITGLTIQQSSISFGNSMTIQAIVYGYNTL